MKVVILTLGFLCLSPVVVYFCVKFGVLAFYKAKEYIEKDNVNQNGGQNGET